MSDQSVSAAFDCASIRIATGVPLRKAFSAICDGVARTVPLGKEVTLTKGRLFTIEGL